jgi:hypothetical protein
MTMLEQLEKEKQMIARCEKSLAMEKLKQRRADTRRKIELGGLVIKSGLSTYNKSVILGALIYSLQLIKRDANFNTIFQSIGEKLLFK